MLRESTNVAFVRGPCGVWPATLDEDRPRCPTRKEYVGESRSFASSTMRLELGSGDRKPFRRRNSSQLMGENLVVAQLEVKDVSDLNGCSDLNAYSFDRYEMIAFAVSAVGSGRTAGF